MNSKKPERAAVRLRDERARLLRSTLDQGLVPSDFPARLTRITDRYFQTRDSEILSRPTWESGRISADSFAVLAVGGYGRESLCPHSDLDVLVLFLESVPEQAGPFCRELFLPLWDLGLDLGHGVRGLEECLALAREDHKTFTALLSARFLAGNRSVMHRFAEAFLELAAHHNLALLNDMTIADARHDGQSDPDERDSSPDGFAIRNGEEAGNESPRQNADFFFDLSAENLLEPNIKTSPGGLRDYHRLLWLAVPRLSPDQARMTTQPAGPFSEDDLLRLDHDVTFLLQTRTALHLTVGRKADMLHLELQPPVARFLGFEKNDAGLAVELFLSKLHAIMERIQAMYLAVLRTLHGLDRPRSVPWLERETQQDIILAADGLTFAQVVPFRRDLPGKQVMALFSMMGQSGLPLSWTVREAVACACATLLHDVGENFETLQELTAILMAPGGVQAGHDLLASGVLGALIPEFGRVQDRIQFDAYHLRPLGAHTMETLAWLNRWSRRGLKGQSVRKGKRGSLLAGNRLQRLPETTSLVLGALLHDIGKGASDHAASDHAASGAEMAARILERFQVPEPILRETTFLVREHLLLFKTATRKDLHDEQVVAACAERIGDETRLDRLFLLSMADARATGPKAWNEWTASLLQDLYFKVRKLFVHGPLSEPQAMARIERVREDVRRLFSECDVPEKLNDTEEDELDELLRKLPLRYLLTTPPATIFRHIRLVARLRLEVAEERRRIPGGRGGRGYTVVKAADLPEMGCHEVTFTVLDQPGIFPVLCGSLALHEVNVLAAEVVTWPDGVVLTLFKIQDPPDPLHLYELAFRLKQSVRYAMTGKLFLDYRLEEKRRSRLTAKVIPHALPPTVRIDNETSDFSTLIEIIADDRPGCLYQIADTLERLQVHVHRAKIATQADRIADTFAVRDHLGQKITDSVHLREIQNALLFGLQDGPQAAKTG